MIEMIETWPGHQSHASFKSIDDWTNIETVLGRFVLQGHHSQASALLESLASSAQAIGADAVVDVYFDDADDHLNPDDGRNGKYPVTLKDGQEGLANGEIIEVHGLAVRSSGGAAQIPGQRIVY